jgi:hypothetical protein
MAATGGCTSWRPIRFGSIAISNTDNADPSDANPSHGASEGNEIKGAQTKDRCQQEEEKNSNTIQGN